LEEGQFHEIDGENIIGIMELMIIKRQKSAFVKIGLFFPFVKEISLCSYGLQEIGIGDGEEKSTA